MDEQITVVDPPPRPDDGQPKPGLPPTVQPGVGRGKEEKLKQEERKQQEEDEVRRILDEENEDDAGDPDYDPEVTVEPGVVHLISDKHPGTYVRVKYAASNTAAPMVGN